MIQQPNNLSAVRDAWRAATPGADKPGRFDVAADGSRHARIYVHGMVGGWRMDANRFVRDVHALEVDRIDMHVNSPGGFVWDAVSMYEAVLQHPAHVTTHIDGLAASAASFVALAGDEIRISRGARMMIHDAQTWAGGSPDQLREAADLGDSISDDIAGIYAARAGGAAAGWRAAMRRSTWYSAAQAVDAGLAHRIAGDDPATTTNPGASNRSRLIKARAAIALGGLEC